MESSYVPGSGPMSAEICVVGEAPGRQEEREGAPFVGQSGKLKREWIGAAGFNPGKIRFENVYPMFPEPDGFIGNVPQEVLEQWSQDLLARLDILSSVKLIVPTGNTALHALTGLKNITQRRGSLYWWEQNTGRRCKVVPTIHPAAVLREPKFEARCRADWRKIKWEVENIDVDVLQRTLITNPSDAQIEHWMHVLSTKPVSTPLAFDIETNPAKNTILCISFAYSATEAISIPFSKHHESFIRYMIAEDTHPKITQTGHYDCYWLAKKLEVLPLNWRWDTFALSHIRTPFGPHSLAYQASIYTREPWYKGGDEDTGEKSWRSDNWTTLLEYNAKDSAVTWEIGMHHIAHITAKGMLDIYLRDYQAMFMPMLKTMLHGIEMDMEELAETFDRLLSDAYKARDEAAKISGRNLFTFNTQAQETAWGIWTGVLDDLDPSVIKKLARSKKEYRDHIIEVEEKGISNEILQDVLYKHFKFPIKRKRSTKNPTTDEAALLELRTRFTGVSAYEDGLSLIDQVLAYRHKKKQSEFMDPARVDADGRFHFSYSFRPISTRLSSSKNPFNTGGNIQNVDRTLRHPFACDPGHILIARDLSQAESRIVDILSYNETRNKDMLERALAMPWERDVHRETGVKIFQKLPHEIDADERYVSKRAKHAGNYGMQARKLQEVLLKDGYIYSLKQCEQFILRCLEEDILAWQKSVRIQLMQSRTIHNAWGRSITWQYERFGDDLYREAYAWGPQSDIAKAVNHAWVKLDSWLIQERMQTKILFQLHDCLYFSAPHEEAWAVVAKSTEYMQEPHNYYGIMLSIPTELKISTRWDGPGMSWKKLPEREEFEACLTRCI